jgi:hypothetical protein
MKGFLSQKVIVYSGQRERIQTPGDGFLLDSFEHPLLMPVLCLTVRQSEGN